MSFFRRRVPAALGAYLLLASVVVGGWALLDRPAGAAVAPDLQHLSFSSTSVDITSSDALVTATLTVSAPAGFASGCITLDKPNSSLSYWSTCFDVSDRVSGSATSGVYKPVLKIRRYAHTGYYYVGGITLVDVNGVRTNYDWFDLYLENMPYRILVSGTSDVTPPSLQSLSFSADSGDLADGPFESTVTAHVTDAQSGYTGFCIDFGSPQFPTSVSASACLFPAQRVSGDAQDGVYQTTLEIPADASPGSWPILEYHVQDDALNFVNLTPAQLESVGAPAAITLTNRNDTVPSAPLAVAATAGDTSARVSWSAPGSNGGAPILSYTVTAAPGGQTATVNGTTTNATVTGLTNDTTYTFTVHATNGIGAGAESAASNPVTPETTPTAPTDVAASAGVAQATVSWTPPLSNGGSPILGYTVTQTGNCGPAGPLCATATAAPDDTSATVTSLLNGTAYSFTVRAYNAIGNGALSAPSNTVTTAPGVSTAPQYVSGSPMNSAVSLQWLPPVNNGGSPILSYTVTASPGGQTVTVPVSVSSTQHATLTGLANGTTYTFTATANNAYGDSPPSAASAAVKPYGAAEAPTNVHATAGSGSATISWTAPFDSGSAIYDYVITASPGGKLADAAPPATSVKMTGLQPGTSYTFTVKAMNGAGDGATSAPSNAITVSGPPARPAAPRVESGPASGATGSLRVTYTAPANHGAAITKFTATCTPPAGGGIRTATHFGSTAAPITIAGLQTKKAYWCTVTATNAAGTSSASPRSATVAVGSPAAATKVVVVRVAAGSMRVSFAAAAGNGAPVTGYTATCVSSNGGVIRSKSGTKSPMTVTGLTAGKAYRCTVAATNSRGAGAASLPSSTVTA